MSDHVSIVTQRRPAQLASATNLTSANATIPAEVAMTSTSEPPTGSSTTVIVPGVLNYLKIIPLFAGTPNTPAIRVTGWSFCKNNNRWFPSHLCKSSFSLNTTGNGNSINSTVLFGAWDMSLVSGDAKLVHEGTANQGNGFMLIDTVGADLIEISFETSSGAVACNAIISEV
jgi:hypothetical protein